MGIFSKNSKNAEEEKIEQRSLNDITSEQAVSIIKKLSGGEVSHRNKVPDNLIVVSSASGGAGASTVVSNMAFLMNKMGLKVLVIDLNVLMPVQHLFFGIRQDLNKPDLVGYLLGKNTLGEAIEQTKYASVMYANNRGLMDYINCESDQAVNNFKLMISGLRNLFDVILIDSPMKVENTICNYAFHMSDQIYLVWDEGISSIANTEKIRRNMASTGIEAYTKMKVILNKRTDIHYSEYPFNKLNLECVQFIPFEQDVILSSLSSQIFCDKGSSRSKNAGFFNGCLEAATARVLEIGGYIK